MATYSNAPAHEIVSYTNSVNNPGDNYQSAEFELITVPDNTTYQILNCFGSSDSGGARFQCHGIVKDGYIDVSGVTNTGDNQADQYVYFINEYYNSTAGSYKSFTTGANATQSWSSFVQLKEADAEYKFTYYPGTTIIMTIDTYKANSSGEQAACKMQFLKTTFP